MFFIVCFHCAYKSDISFDVFTLNTFLIKLMWYLGELGVNLFMLVSGYFMVSGHFRGNKVILLICQVLFYWFGSIILGCLTGILPPPAGIRDSILLLFPTLMGSYWYVTAYIVIYILSPWINQFIISISQKQYLKFILVMLILYSVIPTLFGLIGAPVEGMLNYTRLVWLFVIYLIGAYLKLYPMNAFTLKPRFSLLVSIICAICMIIFTAFIGYFNEFFYGLGLKEWAYFWPPNTIPMVGLSIGLFGVFLNLKLPSSTVINRIASTTLGIYLLHDGCLRNYIWLTIVNAGGHTSNALVVPYMFFAAACIFAVGIVIDLARQFIEKTTLLKLLKSEWWKQLSSSLNLSISKLLDSWITKQVQKSEPVLERIEKTGNTGNTR